MKGEYRFNELMKVGQFAEAKQMAEDEQKIAQQNADAWMELGNKAAYAALHGREPS